MGWLHGLPSVLPSSPWAVALQAPFWAGPCSESAGWSELPSPRGHSCLVARRAQCPQKCLGRPLCRARNSALSSTELCSAVGSVLSAFPTLSLRGSSVTCAERGWPQSSEDQALTGSPAHRACTDCPEPTSSPRAGPQEPAVPLAVMDLGHVLLAQPLSPPTTKFVTK